jgi:hypothetical protein
LTIFSGTANPALVAAVAELLGGCVVERLLDGEISVRLIKPHEIRMQSRICTGVTDFDG